MAEKRYVVKLASEGDGESYYNTGNGDGAPHAFAGSLFKEEGDAKCLSKCKDGSVVCELEPKEIKGKPKTSYWPLIAIYLGMAILFRFSAALGIFVPQSSQVLAYDCPPVALPEPGLEHCIVP